VGDFWIGYADADRDLVVRELALDATDVIKPSAPHIVPIRYLDRRGRTLVHLLDYDYREADDRVEPARNFTVRLPWDSSRPQATMVSPGGTEQLAASQDDGWLDVVVPELRDHAVVVLST
jgi:hypothetical protein